MPSSDWLVWVLEQGLSEKWEMIIMENFFVKIVQKIKVAADLYRKLPFCKIPEELKKLRLYKIYML